MVGDIEAAGRGNRLLPLLDGRVAEFLHPAAIDADDVVVMLATIQLEHGHPALEMMA